MTKGTDAEARTEVLSDGREGKSGLRPQGGRPPAGSFLWGRYVFLDDAYHKRVKEAVRSADLPGRKTGLRPAGAASGRRKTGLRPEGSPASGRRDRGA